MGEEAAINLLLSKLQFINPILFVHIILRGDGDQTPEITPQLRRTILEYYKFQVFGGDLIVDKLTTIF